MRPIGKVILIGSAIILVPMAYNALTSYLAVVDIDFKPTGIRNFQIDHALIKFDVNYILNNPHDKIINVSNLLVQASFDNGPVIATINQPAVLSIPAKGSITNSFPVQSTNLYWLGVDILEKVFSWFENKTFQMPKAVRLQGTVIGNGFRVPFDEKIALPV